MDIKNIVQTRSDEGLLELNPSFDNVDWEFLNNSYIHDEEKCEIFMKIIKNATERCLTEKTSWFNEHPKNMKDRLNALRNIPKY